MSTTSTCSAAFHSRQVPSVAWTCAVLFLSVSGCGFGGGQMLYMLGFGRGQVVKAEFRLTEGPILILLDDDTERVDWPQAKQYLVDELGQELIRQKAARQIIPPQTLDQLKQAHPNLGKRGCREVGEMAGAEQVLWIQVEDFLANVQVYDALNAAYMHVTVKVINVLEKDKERRSHVRLWPIGSAGRAVSASMSGADVARLKTKDAVSKELAVRLAPSIAKLFYDHRLGDFESKP